MKEVYIGLDVHKKSWSVAIHDEHGLLKQFSTEADASILIDYMRRNYESASVRCCYESGCCGYHIYRDLSSAGWEVMVVNPGDIPRINKQNSSKTDKIDSRYLSRELSRGHLQGIYIPDPRQEQFRSLFRRRNDIVKELRRIKTHIKSMLLYYGVTLPPAYDNSNWSKDMISWVKMLEWKHLAAAQAMQSRIRSYEFLTKEYLQVGNELRSYAREHYRKDYNLLRTVPGIGPLTAIGFLAEVGDIRRFRSIDQLSSYIGLVPSVYSSGSTTYTKGITHRSKHLLRSYLIESAWVAARKDPSLMQYYHERKGVDHKKRVIKIAAKLLNRVYHVIKSGEVYRIPALEVTELGE